MKLKPALDWEYCKTAAERKKLQKKSVLNQCVGALITKTLFSAAYNSYIKGKNIMFTWTIDTCFVNVIAVEGTHTQVVLQNPVYQHKWHLLKCVIQS